MTREEAKDVLILRRDMHEETAKALDMAIEALTIEPSGDEYVPHKACFDCMERATGMCKGTIQEQSWCPYVAKINAEPNKTEHDSCSDCRWEPFKEDAEACKNCKRNYTDKYECIFTRPETIKDRNELLYKIQSEFEAEEARAFADQTKGLKEHAVWNKAIRILEEYIV